MQSSGYIADTVQKPIPLETELQLSRAQDFTDFGLHRVNDIRLRLNGEIEENADGLLCQAQSGQLEHERELCGPAHMKN